MTASETVFQLHPRVRLVLLSRRVRVFGALFVAVGVLTACLGLGAGGSAQGEGGRGGGRPQFYGTVLLPDSSVAPFAQVWTEPQSLAIEADADGYWEITAELTPRTYDVRAELDGVEGRTPRVRAQLGQSSKVVIVLGQEETEWPPPTVFERFLPKITKGPKRNRGGDR